jgi:hypothetical protein
MPGMLAEAGQLEALDRAVVSWLTISCTTVPSGALEEEWNHPNYVAISWKSIALFEEIIVL